MVCFKAEASYPRLPCIALIIALICQFITSLSLPFLPPAYIVRTSFNGNSTKERVSIEGYPQLTQINLGIWAPCYASANNGSTCSKARPGYNVTVTENKSRITVVQSSWTGGLPMQLFATGFTTVTLPLLRYLFGKSHFKTVATLVTLGLAGSASILTVFINLALFGFVKGKMKTLSQEAGVSTNVGLGFVVTLISTFTLIAVFLFLFFTRDGQQKQKQKQKQIKEDPDKDAEETNLPEPIGPFGCLPGVPRDGRSGQPFNSSLQPSPPPPQTSPDDPSHENFDNNAAESQQPPAPSQSNQVGQPRPVLQGNNGPWAPNNNFGPSHENFNNNPAENQQPSTPFQSNQVGQSFPHGFFYDLAIQQAVLQGNNGPWAPNNNSGPPHENLNNNPAESQQPPTPFQRNQVGQSCLHGNLTNLPGQRQADLSSLCTDELPPPPYQDDFPR